MRLVYIAGKYTGPTHDGDSYTAITRNILDARDAAVKVWRAGAAALCPHLNTAHFEIDCSSDAEMYYKGDLEMLRRCDAIFMLPSWEDSTGSHKERDFARLQGIPIFYVMERLMSWIREDE